MSDTIKNGLYVDLLVVSLEQAVAAPLCSGHFAQAGARVIKIERDTGDFARKYDKAVAGSSSYFTWANHGKESLCLDIKATEDAALLDRILSHADIFIQNLAPGATGRAGFGSDVLRRKYPSLITCDISGYGEAGDYQDMKAYDFLVQCESGLVAVNGAPDAPGRIGVSICDIGASMNAIIGLQKALLHRAATGEGSGVKVSLFDTAADWMTVPLMHTIHANNPPKPVGLHHPSIAPYGGFETSDGEILAISVQNEREWQLLCTDVLCQQELATDERFNTPAARVKNRTKLDYIIASFFALHSRPDLEEKLRSASIAYGAVNSLRTVAQHPQLRFKHVKLEDGQTAKIIASPIVQSFEQVEKDLQKVPVIGEHTDTIRAEFGC